MPDLTGKVAIVTGGAQGIGGGIVRVLSGYGAAVVFNDVDVDAATKTLAETRNQGADVRFVAGDVTSESDVALLVREAVDAHGRLDAVVNNAGTIAVEPLEEATVESWDRLFAINVRSVFLTSKHALPHLKGAGGTIVNVGSVSGLVGQQDTPAYCATKGAVVMLSRGLALDYARDGVRVNCLCPGITDTPLLRLHMSHAQDPEAQLAERIRRVPSGKLLAPTDLGEAAAFLISDAAAQITGTTLVVDGGYSTCAEFSA